MSILPTWPIAAGTLALGLAIGAGTAVTIKNAKIDRIMAAHAEESRQREAVRASDEQAARTNEQELQNKAGLLAQEKQIEINRIAAERDALVISLRNRPERPAARPGGAAPTPTTCTGATGADLYRRDSEFLVGLAARADTHRAALGQCYAQYDAARAQLSAYANATMANDTAARPQNAANR